MSGPTVAAVLTPAGRSAIAVVAVAGARAIEAVDACFTAANGRALADQPIGAIRFGRWCGKSGEELVISRRPTAAGGQPADRQPIVEISCHGGSAAVRRVLDDLIAEGCTEIDWREWLARSAASPIATAAQVALSDAATERAAGVLLDQVEGALERELQTIIGGINTGEHTGAAAAIDRLLERAAIGQHLTEPWRVVIAGPPNAGKSSLMNALCGYERAIVFDQQGVTRDVVTARTALDGWPVELRDTAGLRDAQGLEAAGVELARRVLGDADLVLMIADAAAGDTALGNLEATWSDVEQGAPPGTPRLRVANKIDLAPSDAGADVSTSATSGTGVDQLAAAIVERLVPTPPAPGDGVPFTARQVAALQACGDALERGDRAAANEALQALLAPSRFDGTIR